MDGFGFGNWNSNDDSYDSSPNKYDYSSRSKRTTAGNSRGGRSGGDNFDFDISNDYDDSPVQRKVPSERKTATSESSMSRFGGITRRSSIEDRAKEILERNKAVGKSVKEEDDQARLQSYEDTFKDLMDGLDVAKYKVDPSDSSPPSRSVPDTPASRGNFSQSRLDSSLESPMGDSLEISATDLEVGALAAKRAKEKAHDRRRRMSLDKAPHTLDQSSLSTLKEQASSMHGAKVTHSPELLKKRNPSHYGSDMQFSAALSSIHKSHPTGEDATKGGGEFARYGSMGHSDDDIYKMLNVTAGTHESIKFDSDAAAAVTTAGSAAAVASRASSAGDVVPQQPGNSRSKNVDSAGGGSGGGAFHKSVSRGELGYISDMTQGSQEEEEEDGGGRGSSRARNLSATGAEQQQQQQQQRRPSLSRAPTGMLLTRKGGGLEEDDEDEDGARGGTGGGAAGDGGGDNNSGDSNKARSPKHSPAQQQQRSLGGDKGQAARKKDEPEDEDEDEYSLDDFEQGEASPENTKLKGGTGDGGGAGLALPFGASQSEKVTSGSVSGSAMPSSNAPSSPAAPGLHRTASMPSTAGDLNSVEEIMQRWYSADSDFMQKSLDRIGSSAESAVLVPTGTSPTLGLATSSADGIAATGTAATAGSTGGSSGGDGGGGGDDPAVGVAMTVATGFDRSISDGALEGGVGAGGGGGSSVAAVASRANSRVGSRDPSPSPLTTAAPTPLGSESSAVRAVSQASFGDNGPSPLPANIAVPAASGRSHTTTPVGFVPSGGSGGGGGGGGVNGVASTGSLEGVDPVAYAQWPPQRQQAGVSKALVSTVGSASMVTSVPPAAPPVMVTSVDAPEHNVFELSDSFLDDPKSHDPIATAAAAPTSAFSAVTPQLPAAAATGGGSMNASSSSTPQPSVPAFFSTFNRRDSNSYLSLDQLPGGSSIDTGGVNGREGGSLEEDGALIHPPAKEPYRGNTAFGAAGVAGVARGGASVGHSSAGAGGGGSVPASYAGSVSPSLSAASRYREEEDIDVDDQPQYSQVGGPVPAGISSKGRVSSNGAPLPPSGPSGYHQQQLHHMHVNVPTVVRSGGQQQEHMLHPPQGRYSGESGTHAIPYHEYGDNNSHRPQHEYPYAHSHQQPPPPPLASVKRKMAASTAAKIKQHRKLSPDQQQRHHHPHRTHTPRRHGVSKSVGAATESSLRKVRHYGEAPTPSEVEQESQEAVHRLTQENWRLFRKYERLEHELKEMRASVASNHSQQHLLQQQHQHQQTAGKTPPGSRGRRGGGDTGGSGAGDSAGGSGAASAGRRRGAATAIPQPLQLPGHPGEPTPGASIGASAAEASFVSSAVPAGGVGRLVTGGLGGRFADQQQKHSETWELRMEEALARLDAENRKLLEREKAVLVREEAVALRESAVEVKEKMVSATLSHKGQVEDKHDFFLQEEIRILREREQSLLVEMDKLKAALFVRKQNEVVAEDNKARQSLMGIEGVLDLDANYKPLAKHYAAEQHKAGTYPYAQQQQPLPRSQGGKSGKNDEGEGGKDMIEVDRGSYEQLMQDHAAQERLIDGFQKENDRLVDLNKEKDNELQLRAAMYFNEREELNKELNRLRNVNRAAGILPTPTPPEYFHGGASSAAAAAASGNERNQRAPRNYDDVPLPTSKKTAESLRMELKQDATIRALKDKLAEAENGMGERERELQLTIEKLRRDNRELAGIAANVNMQRIVPQDNDYLQLQTDNRELEQENARLNQKLSWYAENQKLLDSAEEETKFLRVVLNVLRQELMKRCRMDARAVDRLVDSQTASGHRRQQQQQQQQQLDSGGGGEEGEVTATGAAGAADATAADVSVMSGAGSRRSVSGVGSRAPHRHPMDVKKIKELEGVVRDLQESLRKRHPDSVSNLIRAATVSESVQLERQQQDEQVQQLRRELEEIKGQHEKRLRSLRQEHERIKLQYEKVVYDLEQRLRMEGMRHNTAAAGATSGTAGGRTGTAAAMKPGLDDMEGSSSSQNGGGRSSSQVRTLTQALNRINELESQLERVRAFYSKKVEEINRKAETQMRALKRGNSSASNSAPSSSGTGGDGDVDPPVAAGAGANISWENVAPTGNGTGSAAAATTTTAAAATTTTIPIASVTMEAHNQQVEQLTTFYTERLSLMEKELMKTVEELGRVKATAAKAAILPPPPNPLPFPVTATGDAAATGGGGGGGGGGEEQHEALVRRYEHLVQQKAQEREQLQQIHEQRLAELRASHESHVAHLSSQWDREREALQRRLREEEERCSELRRELMEVARRGGGGGGGGGGNGAAAAAAAAAAGPSPAVVVNQAPEMKQFQQMEGALNALEQRLQRREKELMSAVEDTKAAAAVERARLESIHAQECREKDEQLVRFQQELVRLVSALKHWQQTSSNSSEVEKAFPLVV